ncbi:MAG TPA: HU family DNA-binding protein [Planctomycetota bacterium]|nr:HU family DNA-binding protein [Planctomycetota bacterium]
MATITKKDMVLRLANKTGVDKAVCRNVLQTFLDEIAEILKSGDRVEFRHFGVFAPVPRKGRVGRNPKTGTEVVVPPRMGVRFRTGQTLRRLLAGLPAPKFSEEKDEE